MRIKQRFYRLVAALLVAVPLAAPAGDLRSRVHAELERQHLGDDALRIISNVLSNDGAAPARTPALVRQILDDPLAVRDARAIFERTVPAELAQLADAAPGASTPAFEAALDRYLGALAAAQAELMAAVAPFDEAGLLGALGEGMPLARLVALHRAVDDARLAQARRLFLEATARFVADLRSPGMRFPPPQRFASAIGTVVIGGPGPDRHGPDAALIVDPGGDDVYERAPSSAGAISVIVDLAGNDRYRGSDVAVHALSAIVDVAGDDRYAMQGAGLAAAIAGVSVLVDLDGDDEYEAGVFGEGAALFGFAALVDARGNDRYRVRAFGQAYAGTGGIALLWDREGNDTYAAGGLPDPYERGGGISFSQGAASGARGALAGGIGILRDDAGDDRYEGQMFVQGTGYYYALGLLWDRGGSDRYAAVRYAQGNGVHQAAGMLHDEAGDDDYALRVGVGQGMGLDLAVGLLFDDEGNDRYFSESLAQGTGTANGFGLLADEAGANEWAIGHGGLAWGHAQWLRGLPTVGVLLYDAAQARFTLAGKPAAPAAPSVEHEPEAPPDCTHLGPGQQRSLRAMLEDPGADLDEELLPCGFLAASADEAARLWMAVDGFLVTPGAPFLRPIAYALRGRAAPGDVVEHLGDALRPLRACEPRALWVANWGSADEARAALGAPCWQLQAAALERLNALGAPAAPSASTPAFLRPH